MFGGESATPINGARKPGEIVPEHLVFTEEQIDNAITEIMYKMELGGERGIDHVDGERLISIINEHRKSGKFPPGAEAAINKNLKDYSERAGVPEDER